MKKKDGFSHKLSSWLDRDNVAGYVFILPFIIGLIVFTTIPFFTSLYLAFTNYNILSAPKWVGLDNFKKMFFEDDLFWTSFKVTFKFALIQVPIKLTVALLVALVLSRSTRLTSFYRAAFYIPSLMGGSVAIALLWKQLFSPKGVINQMLGFFGLPDRTAWLGNPKTALGTLIALGVWQFGSSMLIFLAAIKNIPQSYHEAAIVDGAGPVRRFFSITLPMLTPIIFFNLIMQTIQALQNFTSAFVITDGGPMKATYVLGMKLYKEGFSYFKMGYASAISWIIFIVIMLITLVLFATSKWWVFYGDES